MPMDRETNQRISLMNVEKLIKGEEVIVGYESWTRLGRYPNLTLVNSESPHRGGDRHTSNLYALPLMVEIPLGKAAVLFMHALVSGACLGGVEIVELSSMGEDRFLSRKLVMGNVYAVSFNCRNTLEGGIAEVIFSFDQFFTQRFEIGPDEKPAGSFVTGFNISTQNSITALQAV